MSDTPAAPPRFASAPPARSERPVPVPFEIAAWTQPGPNDDPDLFEPVERIFALRARSLVPIGILLDLAGMIEVQPDGRQRINIAPYNRVMAAILWDDDDRKRYYELMHDPALFVDQDTLAAVAQFLSVTIAGRPTGQPSS